MTTVKQLKSVQDANREIQADFLKGLETSGLKVDTLGSTDDPKLNSISHELQFKGQGVAQIRFTLDYDFQNMFFTSDRGDKCGRVNMLVKTNLMFTNTSFSAEELGEVLIALAMAQGTLKDCEARYNEFDLFIVLSTAEEQAEAARVASSRLNQTPTYRATPRAKKGKKS